MAWTIGDVRAIARELRAMADALEEGCVTTTTTMTKTTRDGGTSGGDDDDDDANRELSLVTATTLAGNTATRMRAVMERVRAHAGDAFVDLPAAGLAPHRGRRDFGGHGGGGARRTGATDDGDAGAEADDDATAGEEDEGFEDMFDKDGKPRRGYVPKKGHTLPGLTGMGAAALGELRGVLKKVGIKADGDAGATSSGAEADGEVSEADNNASGGVDVVRETVPVQKKVEKPQWMVELAAKNAAKRSANAAE